MALMIAAGVVAFAGSILGSRKKRKAADKEREESARRIHVAGAEQRRNMEYDNALREWQQRREKNFARMGAQNWTNMQRQGATGGSALMPNLNRWLQTDAPVTAQDPGAMPTAPGPTIPYTQNRKGPQQGPM
jgi:hypothetical protein